MGLWFYQLSTKHFVYSELLILKQQDYELIC